MQCRIYSSLLGDDTRKKVSASVEFHPSVVFIIFTYSKLISVVIIFFYTKLIIERYIFLLQNYIHTAEFSSNFVKFILLYQLEHCDGCLAFPNHLTYTKLNKIIILIDHIYNRKQYNTRLTTNNTLITNTVAVLELKKKIETG